MQLREYIINMMRALERLFPNDVSTYSLAAKRASDRRIVTLAQCRQPGTQSQDIERAQRHRMHRLFIQKHR